jgi:hypothetical protein
LRRRLHPLRLRRSLVSDLNPLVAAVAPLAKVARAERRPAAPANPFLALERAWAAQVEHTLDAWRDWRDAMMEMTFHAVYGALSTAGIALGAELADGDAAEVLLEPGPDELAAAGGRAAAGGYPEAVIRMMILLALAFGSSRAAERARAGRDRNTGRPYAGGGCAHGGAAAAAASARAAGCRGGLG